MTTLSVNRNALKLVQSIIAEHTSLNIAVEKLDDGVTLIDAGIQVQGGYAAGRYITEICMGGFGTATVTMANVAGRNLPIITVATDLPSIALFGAQYAGWKIVVDGFFAMGSGPARALALKPKNLYAQIQYQDAANTAIIVLETSIKPPSEAIAYILRECHVPPENLYVIITPTSSLAGSTQISGRIVETGLHKLTKLGLPPTAVLSCIGAAPIAPVHPKPNVAMGRTNDAILYGGVAFFNVDFDDDPLLQRFVEQTPSSTSPDHGKPFAELFKEAGYDFYKIDPALFAPASVIVNNIKTGNVFKAGEIHDNILQKSFGLS
jgi:methenyltetrahydromethanopterin cyclohydrolase